uniref:DUF547 domain-containing protein n=1 Tax=Macrostomum lignano TaxID=282301 RepID=A0A1I8F8T9_9PLAT
MEEIEQLEDGSWLLSSSSSSSKPTAKPRSMLRSKTTLSDTQSTPVGMTSAEPIIDTGDMPEVHAATRRPAAQLRRGPGGPAEPPSLRQRCATRPLPARLHRRGPCAELKVEQPPLRSSSSAAVASAAPTACGWRLSTSCRRGARGGTRRSARPPLPGPADIDPRLPTSPTTSSIVCCRANWTKLPRRSRRCVATPTSPPLDNADAAAFGHSLAVLLALPAHLHRRRRFARWPPSSNGWSAERIRRIGDLLLSGGLCRESTATATATAMASRGERRRAVPSVDADWLGSGALNADAADWRCRPPDRPVDDRLEQLRCLMLEIQGLCISQDGRSRGLRQAGESEQFAAYRLLARRRSSQPEAGSPAERLAFFINVYNALVLHAQAGQGAPTSLWTRYRFFADSAYIIGGQSYSLLDIEHGVLRANRRGPGLLRAPFGRSDPRVRCRSTGRSR